MKEDLKKIKQALDRFNAEFGRCALYVSGVCCACGLDALKPKVVAVLYDHKVSGIKMEYACVSVCDKHSGDKESLKKNVVSYTQRKDLEAIIV